MLITPEAGSAIEAKASCDKSMVPLHDPGGQWSTILTTTEPPKQGIGVPRFVPLRQVTW